ncbi:hypothetical protein H0H93_013464 [Arthromyces matolae]|nr:hypothetical protein H0H93_013464 [Arthromyces matolae]
MNADGSSTRWQAPELYEAKGNEMPRDTRESDVYALGCVSYQVLTGQEPFVGITRDSTIMSKVLQGERPSRPDALNFSEGHWRLIEGIWGLLEQCWDAVPVKRPTIGTIVKQLEELLPPCIREEPSPLDYLSGAQFRSMVIGYGREEIEQSIGLFESLLK